MKYLLGVLTFIFFLNMLATSVFAETGRTPTVDDNGRTPTVHNSPIKIENPIKADSIQALFEAIIGIILVFAVPIIVFFIIFAGFKYVTAQGNSEAISEANKMLLYALIGGLLILGANVLIEVIQGTVDSITDTSR